MAFRKFASPLRLAMMGGLAIIGVAVYHSPLLGAEAPVIIAPPTLDNPKSAGPSQTAVLAGGCFWGVQGVFEHARGVQKVVAGYAGGEKSTAQYETVSSGSTGHAESVKITFDPAVISYGQILQIAFSVVHDPTQLNRQGPDVGSQYRSAISPSMISPRSRISSVLFPNCIADNRCSPTTRDLREKNHLPSGVAGCFFGAAGERSG
jgi:methionine-S-sulfoxide reductase